VLDPIYLQRSLFLNALLQVVDMLAETRAELNDFHQSSKELEAELQNELQHTERAQRELQAKVIRAENE
jgi:nuclear distribution protein NudE